MNTTNALTFVLRDVNLKKPNDNYVLPIEKNKAELMDFGKVLERLGNGVNSEKMEIKTDVSQTNTSETAKTEDDLTAKHEEFGSKISEKIKSKEPKNTEEEIPAEAVEQFNEEVVSLLCTTLNITPEELMTGMQELGLDNVGDLLQPVNLANLFVHFGNDVSVADILMNEDFQMVKNQIVELEVAFTTEYSLTEEELQSLLETVQNVMETEENVQQVTDDAVTVAGTESENEGITQTTDTQDEEATAQVVVETTDETENSKLAGQQTNADTDTNENDESANSKTSNEFQVEFEATNRSEMVREDVNGQTVRQTNVITTKEGTVVQETVKVVDLQNLVSEVTEYVRLTTGNEFSKIEMQINPANLGKMIVEVSSANGEVTTKIIAQTEAGKEAIESNISQMRTNLEQQGVKVAAVEVTVESHAFEQNLQGESSNEQEQLMREQQEANRKHQMNLNLNEMTLDDLSGLMSEEEMLTVRMMRENGNKIDLTV